MPRLKHIIIGDKEHLTFESIRRLALRQLSKPDELKARKHLNRCSRCQGIYDSFVIPATVRKRRSRRKMASRVLTWVLILFSTVGSASIFLSYEGVMDFKIAGRVPDLNIEEVRELSEEIREFSAEARELSEIYIRRLLSGAEIKRVTPRPPATKFHQDFMSQASPGLDAIDTRIRIASETTTEASNRERAQHSDIIVDGEKGQLTRQGIYGTITADGDPMKGVTVMVPGGSTARVSDADGKYYLQVPHGTDSLLFIYQGKQSIKVLDPESRQQDVQLQIENMLYPEIEVFSPITDNL